MATGSPQFASADGPAILRQMTGQVRPLVPRFWKNALLNVKVAPPGWNVASASFSNCGSAVASPSTTACSASFPGAGSVAGVSVWDGVKINGMRRGASAVIVAVVRLTTSGRARGLHLLRRRDRLPAEPALRDQARRQIS